MLRPMIQLPWPFSLLRRPRNKGVNVGDGVDVGVREVTPHLASLPGVGLISPQQIRKSLHASSMITSRNLSSTSDKVPSTVSWNALVDPMEEISVTVLRLSADKDPVCVVLAEDIAAFIPCKNCRLSRD